MSQNDFNIANQGFPSFRSDLNNALQALASTSAGTASPGTTYAYQFWYDETNELLKMRNSDNDAWITLAAFDQTNDEWEVRSAVIQAVDAAGISLKTDDGTARLIINDDGTITGAGAIVMNNNTFIRTKNSGGSSGDLIGRNSSDQLIIGDPAFSNPAFIKNGNSYTSFENNGSETMRINVGGAVSIVGVLSAAATESKSGNGYVKLPSGIYIQWGVNSANTSGITHNFPIAFPNAAWTLVGVNNNQTNPPAPSCTIISLSQFTLTVSAGGPQVNWIAIGY